MMRAAACSLLLLALLLLQTCPVTHAKANGKPRHKHASNADKAEGNKGVFPVTQPPACGSTCKPVSAAPKCCSRGRAAPSSGKLFKYIDSSSSTGDSSSGGSTVGSSSRYGKMPPAPLKRQGYKRYTGAADAEARDQHLPDGCLMRQSLFNHDIVSTLMCRTKAHGKEEVRSLSAHVCSSTASHLHPNESVLLAVHCCAPAEG